MKYFCSVCLRECHVQAESTTHAASVARAVSSCCRSEVLFDITGKHPRVHLCEVCPEVIDFHHVMRLLGSIWFYGGWEAETKNERDLQTLLEKYGYYFTDEAKLIEKIKGMIDEKNKTDI